MHKAYKFRIYPTKLQASQLVKLFGACRFVYNWGLARKIGQFKETGKSDNYVALAKELTLLKRSKDTVWLNENAAVCLQQSLRNLDTAYQRFFKKTAKFPKFKARGKCRNSATFTAATFRLEGRSLKLTNFKNSIKVRRDKRQLPSTPTSCAVSMTASGKFFLCVLCDAEISTPAPLHEAVGIDLGIETFAATSRGEKYCQPKSIRRLRKKVRRAAKNFSRKAKASSNRNKARIVLARRHEKISNVRKDFLHKLSTKLVRENQTVVLEDLAVKNMMANRKLSRVISEQGWSEFRAMLDYKCKAYHRQLVIIGRFEPTSKKCSHCGQINDLLSLKDRTWKCGNCKTSHDRDVNAAINILAARTVAPACGATVRPVSAGRRPRSRKKLVTTSV